MMDESEKYVRVHCGQSGAYQPGREYVYRYEGHVLSGVPKMSNQFAGLKIGCDVVLQFQRGFNVIAKVRHSSMYD